MPPEGAGGVPVGAVTVTLQESEMLLSEPSATLTVHGPVCEKVVEKLEPDPVEGDAPPCVAVHI